MTMTAERGERLADREPGTGPAQGRQAVLIVNTRARRAASSVTRAQTLLAAAGVPIVSTHALHDAARLSETVRAALADGCDLIILGGGDGSVSAVVDDLAHHQAVLGLLPLGTANDFARTLGLPRDLAQACATIARGIVAPVDLGLVGDNYFVNVASIGVGADLIAAISPQLKRLAGPLAYPVAAARTLLHARPFAATLTFPDGDHAPVTVPRLLQLGVGNGRFYGAGLVVAPGAGADDGLLDVYAIAPTSWRSLLDVARSLRTGTFVQHPEVQHWRTRRVHLETHPRRSINVDGELVARTPAYFSVAPGALRVLVPPQESTASPS